MDGKKIVLGVVGAGVMGTGVAQRFAQYGYDIRLIDISKERLENARADIDRNIRIFNMTHTDRLDAGEILGRISVGVDYAALEDADYIVENVPEIISLKKEVYAKISGFCGKVSVIMANTSCIPITKLASFTDRPDSVIGVHFMNPVPVKRFVEVIRGVHTSQQTEDAVRALLGSAGFGCTCVNDGAGFVSNRLSHIFMNEAANIVMEGIATAEQVDQIFKEGFNHAMGPLHTADLIGLDTVRDSLAVLYECYQDPKYRCSPLLQKMVDAALLGCKSGKGFFEY